GDDSGTLLDSDGAVYILSLGTEGRVVSYRRIRPGESGFTGELDANSAFGVALAALGDLDGDGVRDLAVGSNGSVWILFLNPGASGKGQSETARGEPGFGSSLALLGDLDGDGRPELAVGYPQDDGERGSVSILSLDPDGSVHAEVAIGQGRGGFG